MSDTVSRAKATPEVAFCFLLNQLLERERWARERLAPYEGQAFELRLPLPLLPPLRFTVGADGRIEPGGGEALAAVATVGGTAGETALADELRYLARHLRPDLEEELSRVFGDVGAQRIGGLVRGLARWQADAAGRVGEALAGYAADERRMLVRRVELEALAGDIQRLAQALDALQDRVGRLD